MNKKLNLKSPVLVLVCRIVVGAVFVFSGAAKMIDPWGTAMKMSEYLSLFGMDGMEPMLLSFAIAQCVVEFGLGVMLIFNRGMRLVSLLAMLSMCFFTLMTLYIAVFDPLDDCGCFGEAVRIGNWATFAKNLVLLPASAIVWNASRAKGWGWNRRDIFAAAIGAAITVCVALYGWYVRVPFDNFGIPVGTYLPTDVVCSKCADDDTRLVYRNRHTGQKVVFGLGDTEWHDEQEWEFVDVHTVYDELTHEMLERDFAVWHGIENIAPRIVNGEGTTYMLMINDPRKLTGACQRGMERMLDRQHSLDGGAKVIALMRKSGDGIIEYAKDSIDIGSRRIPLYTVSAKLYGMLLRADAGVVVVHDGVVVGKNFCWRAHNSVIVRYGKLIGAAGTLFR